MAPPIASLYPDYPQYAARLRDGVANLSPEQLAIRAGPEHAPIWALAAHCAVTRVYWLCHVFGEPGAEMTPFADPTGLGWEDVPDHPRAGDELAGALDVTWAIVAATLDRWTIDDADITAERRRGDVIQVMTRASVLNRLMSHDAFHGGEVSQLLGVHHLPPIDLWRRGA